MSQQSQQLTYVKPSIPQTQSTKKLREALTNYLVSRSIPFVGKGILTFFQIKYGDRERFFVLRYDSKYQRISVKYDGSREGAEKGEVWGYIEYSKDVMPLMIKLETEFKAYVDEQAKRDKEFKENEAFEALFKQASGFVPNTWETRNKAKSTTRYELTGSVANNQWRLELYGLTSDQVTAIAKVLNEQ